MISAYAAQAVLYGLRPTIGDSWTLAASAVEATLTLHKAGMYLITNHGPDPVNLKMLPPNSSDAADTNDFALFPVGSGDRSEICVLITSGQRRTLIEGPNVLHAICAAGNTASLRATLVTRHS